MHCVGSATSFYWMMLGCVMLLVLPRLTMTTRVYDLLEMVDKRDAEWPLDIGAQTDAELVAPQWTDSRQKRYTEYQDNALAWCAGECMFTLRKRYGDCYDLCNWNGRTPSPWKDVERQQQQQQHGISLIGNGSPSASYGAMTRVGAGKQKPVRPGGLGHRPGDVANRRRPTLKSSGRAKAPTLPGPRLGAVTMAGRRQNDRGSGTGSERRNKSRRKKKKKICFETEDDDE